MAGELRYPGKVVIVTGGTSGIGLATVREFVRQGANVVFCSKPSEAEVGQTIQRELQNSGCPGDACFEVCDVRKEADIKRLIGATIERYGCLDCLVNNVGTGYAEKTDDISAQKFRDLMEINVVSVLLGSKYALPYLRETKGNIVNIGCMSGVLGAKDALSYSTSKAAVIAMTKCLAIDEIKYGVRVNCISPGFVYTPKYEYYANQFEDPEAKRQQDQCCQLVRRFGTPEEVAFSVLYLAAEGTFCTGSNHMPSGGMEVGYGVKNLMEYKPDQGAKKTLWGPSIKK